MIEKRDFHKILNRNTFEMKNLISIEILYKKKLCDQWLEINIFFFEFSLFMKRLEVLPKDYNRKWYLRRKEKRKTIWDSMEEKIQSINWNKNWKIFLQKINSLSFNKKVYDFRLNNTIIALTDSKPKVCINI